jgi:asparagine synthase (glutamine-hydrolysing)
MCGIFGTLSNNEINKRKLIEVSKILSHRGPDDEGYLLASTTEKSCQSYKGDISPQSIVIPHISSAEGNYNLALLHRRLSIIDLSDLGHQPMNYANHYWITLNGEIYNYLEIKEELKKNGYRFNSNSDTEVVLAAYLKWGTQCVERFNGMWAFALWDKENDLLFLSRDRFGVKPLYYSFIEDAFIFCSEIKGILAYKDKLPDINKDQILNFALFGEVRMGIFNEETVFKNVKQLLPGHNLILKNGKVQIDQYWTIHQKESKLSFTESLIEFKRLFQQSLKYRMRSDVEVGACLSGGIDSSSIVSNATFYFGKQFHTFSAIWPDESCNESFFMQKVNEKWNCIPHFIQPSIESVLDVVDQEIYYQEIPLPGSSLIAQWFVMQKAQEKDIKVLLDGQGADEVLSGYPRYIIPYINELIFHLKWHELVINYKDLKVHGYGLKRILGIQKNKIFGKGVPILPIRQEYMVKNSKIFRQYYQYNYLPDYLMNEVQNTCLPTLLHYEDRNSMAHSVEARVPFLDYQLAEFCLNIPTQHKIKGALTKVILREAMKEVLPVEVYRRRDKIGFSTPIETIFFNKNHAFYSHITNVINKSRISEFKLFDIKKKDEFIPGNEFMLYCLAKFIEKWF